MAWPEKERYFGLSDAFASKYMKRWLVIFAIAILIVVVVFYGGHSASQLGGNASGTPVARSNLDQITAGTPAKKLWVCPMHPQVTKDQPGVCPICGMDLVEMEQPDTSQFATSQPGASHSHGIHLDTASQQRLGVRLAAAKWQTLSQDIHAYGNVAADESLIFNLSAKIEGVIKKLHINSVGQRIEAGDVIYEIYSPELLKSQREFIELLKENDLVMYPPDTPPDAPDPHTSGKGMSEYQMMEMRDIANRRIPISEKFYYADAGIELIDELYRTYVPREVVEIHAPKSGFVTKIDVHEGSAVKPMDNLFSFADSSRVWLDMPLYPDQLAWVKNGDEVTVKLPNAPEIKAHLKFITPLVDSTTRTVQARLSVNNTHNRLLIGSFLDVIIHAKPHKALAVPRSAVMRTGKGDWVMLSGGAGHFTPVKVETGIEAADSIEITAGLQAGDQVAVNGQFLLDAAASMSDTAQRLHTNHDAGKH